MRIKLIPCMLSASTALQDNTARFHGIKFERVMPKFGINIDAVTPVGLTGVEILSISHSFQGMFIGLQEKAISFWKEFANKYRKHPLDEKLENNFHLEIVEEYHEVFAFLVDEFTGVRQMRFIVETY